MTTPSNPVGKRQRRQAVTGAEAMVTMSNAMASLALALRSKSPARNSTSPATRRAAAIQLLENEEGLSDDDKADIVMIFENDVNAVDTYLAFHEDSIRVKWLWKKLITNA